MSLTQHHARARARAFALPMVVLLAVIGALMTAVMLERQAAQQMSIERQLARYRSHHAGRGIKETVGAWLNTVQNEPIDGLLGPGGHALDVELSDGRVISVSLKEAQGSVLNQVEGLPTGQASAVLGILDRLGRAVGAERLADLVRPAGPVKISVGTAPREVLVAAASGVLGASGAEDFANFVLIERLDGKLPTGKLTQAAEAGGASDAQRKALMELVTDKPTLYRIIAEVRDSAAQSGPVYIMGKTEVRERFTGLVVIEPRKGGGRWGSNQQDLLQPLGAFLTWESAPLDGGSGGAG